MNKYKNADAEELKKFLAPAGQANLTRLPPANGLSDFQMVHVKGTNGSPDSIYMHVAGKIFLLSGSSAPWPRVSGVVSGGVSAPSDAVASVASKFKRKVPLLGTMDGTNRTFVIPTPLYSGTEVIEFNGQSKDPGVWYTISGQTITIIGPDVPQAGDSLTATYFEI